MFFNSRAIALLISTLVGIALAVTLSLNGVRFPVVLLSFGITFIICFSVNFFVFEVLFFKEFRRINKVFAKFRGSSVGQQLDADADVPVKRISHELLSFANTKEQEIEKLRKLETFRREFLADISHELKTPVFAAQGFIHTLLDGAIDDERFRDRFLQKSAKSLDQLNNLIQDLMVISQLETGEIKMHIDIFDIKLLIQEVFDILEVRAAKRSVNLVLDIEEDEVLVEGDHNRLSQVFKNLIVNAIIYGHEGGTVTVCVKQSPKDDDVKITISDDGPGIPDEHQKRIFQRFYRVEKSRSREMGGTGLGLSIVKHIIEAHGAKIYLVSKAGKGTTFSFKLKKGYEQE